MKSPIVITEVFSESDFNPSVLFPGAPFTQAFFYGNWQQRVGRRVYRFVISKTDGSSLQTLGMFQLVIFPLSFGKKCGYIPYGPVFVQAPDKETLQELYTFLRSFVKKEKLVFVRLDVTAPQTHSSNDWLSHMKGLFTKSPRSTYHASFMQPRNEWYLDLAQSEDDILRAMHKNTRYSIRVAQKNNVSTEISTALSAHFDVFYEILRETARRDHFHLHPKAYYQEICSECEKHNSAVLVMSSYQGVVLTAHLVVLYGDTAMLAFAGSRNEHRDVMPAYAAQWATIQYLRDQKRAGQQIMHYNFGGVSGENDAAPSWKGLTSFKKRFGGRLVQHADLYDVVGQPFWYYVYTIYKLFRK